MKKFVSIGILVFRLRISLRIRSPNRNGSKFSVRNLCRTDICKNPRKSASLPCPYIDCLSCSNLAEEIIEDVMLIIFIYIYKLIICKIQIINCKGAYRNAEWGERPADTGPGMEMYPAMYRDLRIRPRHGMYPTM